ncbi:hypothetical protein V6N11_072997 [Hibiscus sabdariffa]|uniref:Uncharacterized protein n=1 Tax=Hibiscus sabdariffa TaxID=183260 RepID=A0ABR2NWW4_9ROSI
MVGLDGELVSVRIDWGWFWILTEGLRVGIWTTVSVHEIEEDGGDHVVLEAHRGAAAGTMGLAEACTTGCWLVCM